MSRDSIYYFTEDVQFELPNAALTTDWIQAVIQQEGYQLVYLNFIFCSDPYLHSKNVQYLQHDTFTDVISFSYSEKSQTIEGEIYISIERVMDNAKTYCCTFWQELYRVMIHGVLHLLGYSDKTLRQKEKMRTKEDAYLRIPLEAINLPSKT